MPVWFDTVKPSVNFELTPNPNLLERALPLVLKGECRTRMHGPFKTRKGERDVLRHAGVWGERDALRVASPPVLCAHQFLVYVCACVYWLMVCVLVVVVVGGGSGP